MYWRSKPEMSASVSAPDWPRNGAKLKARALRAAAAAARCRARRSGMAPAACRPTRQHPPPVLAGLALNPEPGVRESRPPRRLLAPHRAARQARRPLWPL